MGLLGNKPWIKLGALAAIAGAVAIAWQVDAQTRATSPTHGGSGGAHSTVTFAKPFNAAELLANRDVAQSFLGG